MVILLHIYIYLSLMDITTNSNFSYYVINRLGFITEAESVYSAVRTLSLHNTDKGLISRGG